MQLSIVIPVYNVEEFIAKTITSLVSDNHIHLINYEIIIVNDGSTDQSIKIASDILAKSNCQWKIINQENQGVSAARNTGINYCNGKYIYFIDSDDYVLSNMFKIIKKIIKEDYDLIFWNYQKVDTLDNILKRYKSNYINISNGRSLLIDTIKNQKSPICIGNAVYRRSVILKYELKFNTSYINGEDLGFIYKYLYVSNRIYFLEDILFNYVIHRNSISNKFTIRKFDSILAINEVISFVILNHRNEDSKVVRLLKVRVVENYIYNMKLATKTILWNEFKNLNKILNDYNREIIILTRKYENTYKIESKKYYIYYILIKYFKIIFYFYFKNK